MRSSRITIHYEPHLYSEIDIPRMIRFVEELFPTCAVESRPGSFFDTESVQGAIIMDLKRRVQTPDVRSETAGYACGAPEPAGEDPKTGLSVPYDGFVLCDMAAQWLSTDACAGGEMFDVVFTELLMCTFGEEEEGDCRYHARALVGANPAVISVRGIVEAAARPREYYVERLAYAGLSDEDTIDEKYDGMFVVRHDSLMPGAACGYLLQALMYYETGDLFCADRRCRLYNAHWQDDLVRTQILEPRMCSKHYGQILKMRTGT